MTIDAIREVLEGVGAPKGVRTFWYFFDHWPPGDKQWVLVTVGDHNSNSLAASLRRDGVPDAEGWYAYYRYGDPPLVSQHKFRLSWEDPVSTVRFVVARVGEVSGGRGEAGSWGSLGLGGGKASSF